MGWSVFSPNSCQNPNSEYLRTWLHLGIRPFLGEGCRAVKWVRAAWPWGLSAGVLSPVCVPWEWLLPPVLSPEGKVGAAASVAEVTSVAEVWVWKGDTGVLPWWIGYFYAGGEEREVHKEEISVEKGQDNLGKMLEQRFPVLELVVDLQEARPGEPWPLGWDISVLSCHIEVCVKVFLLVFFFFLEKFKI